MYVMVHLWVGTREGWFSGILGYSKVLENKIYSTLYTVSIIIVGLLLFLLLLGFDLRRTVRVVYDGIEYGVESIGNWDIVGEL